MISREELVRVLAEINELFKYDSEEKVLMYQSLICFLFLSGVRISEALLLKRKDFWHSDGFLNVRVPILKRGKRKSKHLDEERILFFKDSEKNKDLLELITDYVGLKKGKDFVWPVGRVRVWKIFDKFNLYPHLFRHTRAQIFADAGKTGEQAMPWFGWSDARTFSKYLHVSKKSLRDLAEVV